MFNQLSRRFAEASKSQKFNGMILFGLPGAGKGTYGSLVAKDFKVYKIAPGDLLRKILKEDWFKSDPHYKTIKDAVEGGKLVADNVVLDLVSTEYNRNAANYNGVLFDGIPRTVRQAQLLKEKFDLSKFLLVNVILREDILIEKLLGRRVCDGCGKNYNVCSIHKDGYEMEPLLSAKGDNCEVCNGKLIQRSDDKEDIIKKRIEVYKQETFPVMAELQKIVWRTMDFEPKRGVKDYPLLKKSIEDLK